MRAVLTSVDYVGELSICLPFNRHHFSEVMVVTAPGDDSARVARENDCRVFETTVFWDDGAHFNKWKALEQGLDVFGRHGWLCLMDADVLWPRSLPGRLMVPGPHGEKYAWQTFGCLHTPLRRMMVDVRQSIPPESEWNRFPLHHVKQEWSGYSQIFHANDPHLGPRPWHQTDWLHAGGADSFFQAKWPADRKIRPPWECLHIGLAGVNWVGRASPYLDGSAHPNAAARAAQVRDFIRRRRPGPGRFDHEKLG